MNEYKNFMAQFKSDPRLPEKINAKITARAATRARAQKPARILTLAGAAVFALVIFFTGWAAWRGGLFHTQYDIGPAHTRDNGDATGTDPLSTEPFQLDGLTFNRIENPGRVRTDVFFTGPLSARLPDTQWEYFFPGLEDFTVLGAPNINYLSYDAVANIIWQGGQTAHLPRLVDLRMQASIAIHTQRPAHPNDMTVLYQPPAHPHTAVTEVVSYVNDVPVHAFVHFGGPMDRTDTNILNRPGTHLLAHFEMGGLWYEVIMSVSMPPRSLLFHENSYPITDSGGLDIMARFAQIIDTLTAAGAPDLDILLDLHRSSPPAVVYNAFGFRGGAVDIAVPNDIPAVMGFGGIGVNTGSLTLTITRIEPGEQMRIARFRPFDPPDPPIRINATADSGNALWFGLNADYALPGVGGTAMQTPWTPLVWRSPGLFSPDTTLHYTLTRGSDAYLYLFVGNPAGGEPLYNVTVTVEID